VPNTDYFNQVARDWDIPPFLDIQIYDEATNYTCPSEHPVPVFEHIWLGTDIACDCLGIYSEWI